MFGKKEITPAEMQELNRKSFKDTQKIFRKRLREIAAGGENKVRYRPNNYCCGDRIADWLKSLGFTVKQNNPIWCEITWPEEEDVCEKLRRECLPILNSTLPEAARDAVSRLTFTKEKVLGEWIFDSSNFDYVCSACGKHAEYTTSYCPNCGKKMKSMEGRKYE